MKESHLSLNTEKTCAVSFITIKLAHLDFNPPTFLLYDKPIIPTSAFKYLGYVIDDQLYFLSHIKYINGKAKTLYNEMRQVAGNLLSYSF